MWPDIWGKYEKLEKWKKYKFLTPSKHKIYYSSSKFVRLNKIPSNDYLVFSIENSVIAERESFT